jgi:hypothetical protein
MNHNALVSLEAAPTSAGQADAEVIDLEPIGSEQPAAAEPLQSSCWVSAISSSSLARACSMPCNSKTRRSIPGFIVPEWEAILAGLSRRPFVEQANVVHAVAQLLLDAGKPAAVINGEMGTGKTMMGIAAATILHHAGLPRCLVIAPPHLVYKWRREIIQTVPKARVGAQRGRHLAQAPGHARGSAKVHPSRRRPSSLCSAVCACAWASTGACLHDTPAGRG